MEKLTKEQVSLFTALASVLMLVAFFFVRFQGKAPIELFDRVGWFGVIVLILDLLTPIYLCLYAYRDWKALEPLKPIFGIGPSLAYSLPLIALSVTLFAIFYEYGWSVILFAIGAICTYCIGKSDK